MISRILIIPARAGSKRLKNKNIKKLDGDPIIYHSIKVALKSKMFNEIHVSTENENIKKIVQRYPLNIRFLRAKKLSSDRTPLMKVFKFVFDQYLKINILFDEIWYMMPCSPLIDKQDLVKACKSFKKSKFNSLLAVSDYSPPIQWAFYKKKNKSLVPIDKKKMFYRSQDLKKTYYDSGTFGAFKKEVFLKNIKPNFFGFEIERFKAIDVDTVQDWKLLTKIYNSSK